MFNPWTFLFEIANFLILAYLLHRLLYRPLMRAVDRRRDAILTAEADAATARDRAADAQRQVDSRLASVEGERQTLLRVVREEVGAERQRLLAQAEREAERRLEDCRRAVAQERQEALAALREEVVQSAVDVASRLLREGAETSLHEQLAAHVAATLEHLPNRDRDALRAAWQPADGAVVEVAESLPAAALARLTEAIASLVGQAAAVDVQVLPSLIGGARVRLGGMVWDGSLAAQLASIEQPGAASGAAGVRGSTPLPAGAAGD